MSFAMTENPYLYCIFSIFHGYIILKGGRKMKQEYEKPELIEIELVSEETVSLGCWRTVPSSC